MTEETLSLDVIREVCRGEGHYLGTQQSLEMMHSEFYYPHTADRRSRDDWLNDGGQDMRSIARQKVQHIRGNPSPSAH